MRHVLTIVLFSTKILSLFCPSNYRLLHHQSRSSAMTKVDLQLSFLPLLVVREHYFTARWASKWRYLFHNLLPFRAIVATASLLLSLD